MAKGGWRAVQGAGVFALALVLAACATPAPRDAGAPAPDATERAVDEDPAQEKRDTPERERDPTPGAALQLAQQAESARQAGDTARAEQRLERALRIAPRDAGLWHQMAALRLEQGRHEQAERLAERSLRLAGGTDRELGLKNWRVILAAREALGDAAGAEEAREAIRRLEADVV
ncbi:tetratricopeptide repeat protein [Thioalkalivibrio sp. ALE28]|uniref:tetratricopeptide repeat protein n=1 Tax=Thioalkalivibrio sp. ALE28 TaxID=1158179 RepID=UPI0003639B55|nr:tetratricopeptide repeat protein [Thioalkalivibrio sp. ALE28]